MESGTDYRFGVWHYRITSYNVCYTKLLRDCSGHTLGRQLCIRATRQWGRMVMIGEGGTVEFNPSPDIIHDQITIYGSWVTNIWRMEELVERIVRWGIHPEDLVTHRFTLDKVDVAYDLMAQGKCGKVAVSYNFV